MPLKRGVTRVLIVAYIRFAAAFGAFVAVVGTSAAAVVSGAGKSHSNPLGVMGCWSAGAFGFHRDFVRTGWSYTGPYRKPT